MFRPWMRCLTNVIITTVAPTTSNSARSTFTTSFAQVALRTVSIIASTGAIQEPLIEKGSGFEVIRLPSRVVEALATAAVATMTTVCAVVFRVLIAEAVFKHSHGSLHARSWLLFARGRRFFFEM